MPLKKVDHQDIALIQTLAEQSWRIHYAKILSKAQIDYMLGKMYATDELLKHFENPNYHYYLIQNQENQSLGFMGFEVDYQPQTTMLHRLYLLEEATGKKLGQLAIDFLKSEAQQQHNQRIILYVNKENSARYFYEKQGFSIYDEGIFDIGNGFVMDDFLMEYRF
ncbi:GNAT family N-acetyltransferase [Riemerella columbina]|uniref:GNAT family N-acetyltransferase n=1 Tax=Riemerella columbina TaxID=103810 RepID=UPI00266F2F23|nr:GNAT family N-acetyltransferase [Riemerella columbina]WKS96028.1 GNAT family N-acetyltransferase [Riemerella columbina]